MKRRQFMSGTFAAGLGVLSLTSCTTLKSESGGSGEYVFDNDEGNTFLTGLRERYHKDLFEEFLPNMDSLVVDHEYGGFMCSVNIETRQQASSNKSAWFEGRGLWTYSFLYNNFGRDPRYLEIARKSKDFIMQFEPTDGSFWGSSYSREGKALSGPGDIYCSLFVAEGLAEYAKASGESQYLDKAKDIIRFCMERYDREDYTYTVGYLSPDAPKVTAPRVLGHWMIFIRSLTQILEMEQDAEMEKLADRCLDAILNHHLNPEYNLFNELLNHDLSRPDNEFKDFAYTGHGIETCWMLMFEAARRKDRFLFERCAGLFKRHIEVAGDRVYGGYFRSLDHVGNNVWKVDKVLWLQEEILIGSLFLAEQTGDPWAQQCVKDTLAYVHENFVKSGYAFWISAGNRVLDVYQKVRAEHYHHPRHLMLNLLALDRISGNKGKVKSLFS